MQSLPDEILLLMGVARHKNPRVRCHKPLIVFSLLFSSLFSLGIFHDKLQLNWL